MKAYAFPAIVEASSRAEGDPMRIMHLPGRTRADRTVFVASFFGPVTKTPGSRPGTGSPRPRAGFSGHAPDPQVLPATHRPCDRTSRKGHVPATGPPQTHHPVPEPHAKGPVPGVSEAATTCRGRLRNARAPRPRPRRPGPFVEVANPPCPTPPRAGYVLRQRTRPRGWDPAERRMK